MRDEQIALMLVSALALMGVRCIPVAGPVIAPPMAALLCLLASSLGAGPGAAAGLLYGAALSFSGGDRFVGAALGLCAMTAGAAGALGRWAGALAFALTNTVTLLYGMGASYGALNPIMAFLAGLTTASCRRNSWRGCGRVRAADTGHDPERLAARLLNDARRRVKALGQVFGELASGYDSPAARRTSGR